MPGCEGLYLEAEWALSLYDVQESERTRERIAPCLGGDELDVWLCPHRRLDDEWVIEQGFAVAI